MITQAGERAFRRVFIWVDELPMGSLSEREVRWIAEQINRGRAGWRTSSGRTDMCIGDQAVI